MAGGSVVSAGLGVLMASPITSPSSAASSSEHPGVCTQQGARSAPACEPQCPQTHPPGTPFPGSVLSSSAWCLLPSAGNEEQWAELHPTPDQVQEAHWPGCMEAPLCGTILPSWTELGGEAPGSHRPFL